VVFGRGQAHGRALLEGNLPDQRRIGKVPVGGRIRALECPRVNQVTAASGLRLRVS
jgi:hypothetical protein